MASLAWHIAGRFHGDSGTSEGRCGLLPSDDWRRLMAGEPWKLNLFLQHKHMLPVCVCSRLPRSVTPCSYFTPRHFIIRFSQDERLTLGAPGIMITAGRQLSERVGSFCIDPRRLQYTLVPWFMRNPICEMFNSIYFKIVL